MSWASDFGDWIGNQFTPSQNNQPQVAADVAASGPQGMGSGTGTAPPGNASPSLLSQGWNLISGGGGIPGLTKNLSPLIAAGGIGNALLRGPGQIPQKAGLEANAAQLQQNAGPLLNAMNTGELPPGEESMVDQQLQSQINGIKAKYAQMGLSGSTMEQQDISNAQNSATAQRAQLAQQATQTGISESTTASADLNQLAEYQLKQQEDLQNQIAAMLQAFGGGSGAKKEQ